MTRACGQVQILLHLDPEGFNGDFARQLEGWVN
jgi:hypothetical protein